MTLPRLHIPAYHPDPYIPTPRTRERVGWEMVEVEVTIWEETAGRWLIKNPRENDLLDAVFLPKLLTDHEPFDGKITSPTRATLTMPRWLAEDAGLVKP